MTNTEQLRQLLKNAIDEGFSAEDIEDLAREVEDEKINQDEIEDYLDELQNTAAEALADFLVEIGYYDNDDDYDFDKSVADLYNSLQLIREGKLKVSVKSGCCGKCKNDDDTIREAIEMLRKFF